MYIYLVGTLIYVVVWIVFFFKRKDLRKKLFYSSLLATPLGISDLWFVPEYWNPQFERILLFKGLSLESFLFCFFLGGVVATFYQVLFKKKLFKFKKINPLLTLIAPIIFLSYFLNPLRMNIIFYSYMSMFIGSFIVMLYLGKKISKQIVYSGIINTCFYGILYIFLWHLFPELPISYQFENLIGIGLMGVPIEEILWVLSFSLYWTPWYEIWKNYFSKNS